MSHLHGVEVERAQRDGEEFLTGVDEARELQQNLQSERRSRNREFMLRGSLCGARDTEGTAPKWSKMLN